MTKRQGRGGAYIPTPAERAAKKGALAAVRNEYGAGWQQMVLRFSKPKMDRLFAALASSFGDAGSSAVFVALLAAQRKNLGGKR